MAKKLDKVISIGGEEFQVTAEMADKVKNSLTIYKVNLNGSTSPETVYDGGAAKTIEIVPASGGAFKGRITVPDYTNTTEDLKAVLNYGDIKNKLLSKLINTSIVYTFDNSGDSPVLTPAIEANTVGGINLVRGPENACQDFAELNNQNYESDSSDALWLFAYLYICLDTGNFYFGSYDSAEALRLAGDADSSSSAIKLATPRTIKTSLGSTEAASFDGTANITPGISGILQPNHGGTGATSLSSVAVGYARQLQDASDGRKTATAVDVIANTDNINKIVSGDTAAAKATNAENAAKLGNQAASYYQKKITLSTNGPNPSDGSEGDIWIVWKNS